MIIYAQCTCTDVILDDFVTNPTTPTMDTTTTTDTSTSTGTDTGSSGGGGY